MSECFSEEVFSDVNRRRFSEETLAKKKASRAAKQQLGQFMTPDNLVEFVLDSSGFVARADMKVLEPSFGEGAFLFAVIDRLLDVYPAGMSQVEKVKHILRENVYGVEFDEMFYNKFKSEFLKKYQVDLDVVEHHFVQSDFFRWDPPVRFDAIVGNPPFGGTFDPELEDALDKKYGRWNGFKVKKETYAFFTAACLEMLAPAGLLGFVLSDTFLTINTMQGLRRQVIAKGPSQVRTLEYFSDETDYGMLVLIVHEGKAASHLIFNGNKVKVADIALTPNYSWQVDPSVVKYFGRKSVGDFVIASSGMTIGRNEWFLRSITEDNCVMEPFDIQLVKEPITVSGEVSRARLGKLSASARKKAENAEAAGETRVNVRASELPTPKKVPLPHSDYTFYNKAQSGRFYAAPDTVVYWRNDGEAVYAFKKAGAWYLHGVGGKPFFKKEGFTWNLISTSIKARYLPAGYILDSGAPVGVLRDGVDKDELWFILGWLNTAEATRVLKKVINHTKNIQSKDIERMPYPWWVSDANKAAAVQQVKALVSGLRAGSLSQEDVTARMGALEALYKL